MAIEIPLGKRRRYTVKRGTESAPHANLNYSTDPTGIVTAIPVEADFAMVGLALGSTTVTFTWQGQSVTEQVDVVANPLTIEWGDVEDNA